MTKLIDIFTDAERAAWLPPERWEPAEWAEEFRMIPPGLSAEPGKFTFARTPYWREVCNDAANKAVEEVCCLKCTQVGWSELIRSILGFCIDQEPGPAMFLMPNEKSTRELMKERIRPLVEHTPRIAAHAPTDPDEFTHEYIRFDTMEVFTGWAGSPQSVATRPIRYLFPDEVDKYPPFSGREADPISLARERTTTYKHRKKILIGSTPTLRLGNICKAFEACDDQRCYFVPCPHCSHYQRLVLTGLKYGEKDIVDKNKRAAAIELNPESVWYECESCKGHILERHRNSIAQRGLWVSGKLDEDWAWSPVQAIASDDTSPDPRPPAKRVGYWVTCFNSPWKSFQQIAAEYVRSQGDVGKMMNFKNSWLAEPFEDQVASVKSADIQNLKKTAPRGGTVPEWAQMLITTADVQANGTLCYYVVRAWGPNYRSQLVDFGTTPGVEHLRDILNRNYDIGDHPQFGKMGAAMLCVDARYVPTQVYQFAATDARIVPIIGASGGSSASKQPLTQGIGSKELGVIRYEINTNYYKDQLHGRRSTGLWLVNDSITDVYAKHLAAEHKVKDPRTNKFSWVPVSQGAANHLLDCEVYQQAAADIAQVNLLEEPQPAPNPIPIAPGDEPAPELQQTYIDSEGRQTIDLGII